MPPPGLSWPDENGRTRSHTVKIWMIGIAIVVFICLAAIALTMLAGFADIPCQDGVWDDVRKTCVSS